MGIEIDVSSDVITQAAVVSEFDHSSGNTSKDATKDSATPASSGSHDEHGSCANCGAILTGAYCHVCGQHAHIHRSLLHMFEELLHGLFHFETKAWRTIPALIYRPGKLTRQYIEGKRTSFVSPLALFLFMIFLMFFVFSFTMKDPAKNLMGSDTKEEVMKELDQARQTLARQKEQEAALIAKHETVTDIQEEIKETQTEIMALELAATKAASDTKKSKEEVEQQLQEAKTRLSTLETEKHKLGPDVQKRIDISKEISSVKKEIHTLEVASTQLSDKKNDSAKSESGAANTSSASSSSDDLVIDIRDDYTLNEIPGIGSSLAKANANRELTLYKMKANSSKLAFLLMPISLPFLWLLFAFRRRYVMFDHAVFSLYSLSFMCVLLIIMALLNKFNFTGTAVFLLMIVPPIHMYLQLRDAYQLSVFGTLWRTAALLLIALVSLLIYAMIVTGMSI
ncbi:DUF3667 domain-containing protein [Undibacterium sp. Rencai35W]|uniref:DUF3667 domain-containing protein n=1 Tax=Undibacterium sp. Rencai35W TaxID=3413046 RepID=UPI003BF3AD65